jgi:ubiquinone/menaquinone biosynthesis C-methylase UbiE
VGLYRRFVLPRLIHLVCGARPNRLQREKIVPLAAGEVLEIGFGTGLNIPFFDPTTVSRVRALEPAEEMWELARKAVEASPVPVEPLLASAEAIPLPDASVDTVLVTYSLCTIADPDRALRESRRVLRRGGRLLFCEHGVAPDAHVQRWQERLNPVWRRFSGGCSLNRDIPSLIEASGFSVDSLSTMYLPGWRPATYNYWGSAGRS